MLNSFINLSMITLLKAPTAFSSIEPFSSTPSLISTYASFSQSTPLQVSHCSHISALNSRLRPFGSIWLKICFPFQYGFPSCFPAGSGNSHISDFARSSSASSLLILSLLFVSRKRPEIWSWIPPMIGPPNLGEMIFSRIFINIFASARASSVCGTCMFISSPSKSALYGGHTAGLSLKVL